MLRGIPYPFTHDHPIYLKIALSNDAGRSPFSDNFRIHDAHDNNDNNDNNDNEDDNDHPPTSNICFIAGTKVLTDQGIIEIQKLKPNHHTINGHQILCVTKTITDEPCLVCFKKGSFGDGVPLEDVIVSQRHSVLYDGSLIESRYFVGSPGIFTIPYNDEPLYNIVLDENSLVEIAGVSWETLPKETVVAKYFMTKKLLKKRRVIQQPNKSSPLRVKKFHKNNILLRCKRLSTFSNDRN